MRKILVLRKQSVLQFLQTAFSKGTEPHYPNQIRGYLRLDNMYINMCQSILLLLHDKIDKQSVNTIKSRKFAPATLNNTK